jgi:hypothetical protein
MSVKWIEDEDEDEVEFFEYLKVRNSIRNDALKF